MINEEFQYPEFQQDVEECLSYLEPYIPDGSFLSRDSSRLEEEKENTRKAFESLLVEMAKINFYVENWTSDSKLKEQLSDEEINVLKTLEKDDFAYEIDRQMKTIESLQEKIINLDSTIQVTLDIFSSYNAECFESFTFDQEKEHYLSLFQKLSEQFDLSFTFKQIEVRANANGQFFQTFVIYISPLANNE